MDEYLQLIAKKLSGEINESEEERLQLWIRSSAHNELLYRRLEEIWQKAKYTITVKGQEKTYKNISHRLGIDQTEQLNNKLNPSNFFVSYGVRTAAIIILILGATIGGLWYSSLLNKKTEVSLEVSAPIMLSKRNLRGQKSIIQLPDGSEVRLNADSYLEYPQAFKTNRSIKLVGEAYFDVKPDIKHPFVVNSKDIQVRVLGTSFNIQAFPQKDKMSVAVASGIVTVEKIENGNALKMSQLHPHEMLSINIDQGDFIVSKFDFDDVLAWKDGVLVFNKASFEEIIDKLERWYGVDFIIRRQIPVIDGFTGRYNNPSLKVILEGMSYSSDFKYAIDGDTVIIQ